MPNSIAILEDNEERLIEMRDCLSKTLPRLEAVYFDNAFSMIAWLRDHLAEVAIISLDHDLPIEGDHGTGRDVADFLAGQSPTCPVIVHTSNEHFSPGMMFVLSDAGWPAVRVYPHSDHNWVKRGWADQIRQFIATGWIVA